MATRKTIQVEAIRDRINVILDPMRCPELNADNRVTAAAILSGILHDTGNYRGFQFLDVEHVTDEDGMIVDSIIPDDTARKYF